jgi:ubiquinone biosynthesis protein
MSLSTALPGVDAAALHGLVPEVYADFRPVVAEAIEYFVEHLSAARLTSLMIDQLALPPDADVRLRLSGLLHAAPALHKLGQVLARRRELDPALRARLQELETLEPRLSADQVLPAVARELAPAVDRYRIQIGSRPLAEGSVAVVVPLTYRAPEASGDEPRHHGVVKILKPGVEALLREDLDLLAGVADRMDTGVRAGRFAHVAFGDVLDQVRDLLASEVRLDREQDNLRAAAAQQQQTTGPRGVGGHVHVPGVLPFSTPRATAMERIFGRRFTDAVPGGARRRHATALLRALVGDVVFSSAEDVLFHGDPHAGNLLVDTAGRLSAIDWTLAGHLSLEARQAIAQVVLGALTLDVRRVCSALEGLAITPARPDTLRGVVDREMSRLSAFRPPDLDWSMGLVDAVATAGVRFDKDLLLFRKAFFTLEGVAADLCPDLRPADVLAAVGVERYLQEWPRRAVWPLGSRDYATHLSTADLMTALAAGPRVAAEYWRRAWAG